MKPLRVSFRVDASAQIGTGHWVRCRTLAQALRAGGADVQFISRAPPPALASALVADGIALVELPAGEVLRTVDGPAHASWLGDTPLNDAAATRACLAAHGGGCDWLVVDHYGIDARWHDALRDSAGALLAIDDLADRPLAVDLLVDQGYRHDGRDYAPQLRRAAPVLAGVRHALLQPAFAAARPAALQRRAARAPVSRVLISFGGVDAVGHGLAALQALLPELHAGARLRIEFVLGAAALHGAAVHALAARWPQAIEVVTAVDDMAARMQRADLAFGACGFTAWERCCLGLPTIAAVAADNQRRAAHALAAAGVALLIDAQAEPVAAFAAAWRQLRDDVAWRARMTQAAAAACDGLGTQRVLQAMHGPIERETGTDTDG